MVVSLSGDEEFKDIAIKHLLSSIEHKDSLGYTVSASSDAGDSYDFGTYDHNVKSVDDIITRDEQREKDGFPRKAKFGKMVFPSKSKKDGEMIIVPAIDEEKLVHDPRDFSPNFGGGQGSGDEAEGDVVDESPISDENPSDSPGEGQDPFGSKGQGGEHGILGDVYEFGQKISESFELPNIEDKGKKKIFSHYDYDLTDMKQSDGQVLDPERSLEEVIKTNIALGRIKDPKNLDPSNLLVSSDDLMYKVLSQEKEYKSEAIVFFVRDYSGSMGGLPSEIIRTQHLYIYSWLYFQYNKEVATRYILHDTEAKEVDSFNEYWGRDIGGGTDIVSGFGLVNDIIEAESLYKDYNIYIFYGGDGGQFGAFDDEEVSVIEDAVGYSNRTGITIVGIGNDPLTDALEQYNFEDRYPGKVSWNKLLESKQEHEDIIDSIKELVD